MRSPRLVAVALSLALLAPAAAEAGPCDDPREAWTLVSRAVDALDAGQDAAASALVTPLVSDRCEPSGEGREAIARARLEASLVRLQVTARAQRARTRQAPRPPPSARRSTPSWNAWNQRAFTSWLRGVQAGLSEQLQPSAQALAQRASEAPSVRRDAASLLAEAYAELALALQEAPLPPSLASNRDLAEVYRTQLQTYTEPLMQRARATREAAQRQTEGGEYLSQRLRVIAGLFSSPPPLPPSRPPESLERAMQAPSPPGTVGVFGVLREGPAPPSRPAPSDAPLLSPTPAPIR